MNIKFAHNEKHTIPIELFMPCPNNQPIEADLKQIYTYGNCARLYTDEGITYTWKSETAFRQDLATWGKLNKLK